MIHLRDYQSEAVQSIYDWFTRRDDNPLVVAPTGAGKSVILAEFIRRACVEYPATRILVVTHVKELIAQNHAAICRLWPAAPAGIYSAGLGRRQGGRQIVVAGVQSIAKRIDELGAFDLVIVDEAHLIPRSSDTLYGKLFDGLRMLNPLVKIVGLTATPYRMDSGRLDMGDGAMFGGIAYDIPIRMLVERGYLAPLVSKRPGVVFDTRGLHTRMGDFVESEMTARFATDDVTKAAVREIVALGADRRSWLAFCISVDHAIGVRDEIRRHGMAAECVTGKTPQMERDRILSAYKAGRIRALTSVGVLTTGFDAPGTDLLAFLRPTQSTGLYMQMAGRGMRTSDQKPNCIAEGQRVLTDRGLVEIQNVTTEMKVWDGFEFVSHCGIIFRGEREVISYAGLTATQDHKVWTKEGWKAFGECSAEQTPISITGDGRKAIRKTEGRFRGDCAEEREGSPAHSSRMLWLRRAIAQRLYQLDQRIGWMPEVRKSANRSEMARETRDFSKATLHKSKHKSLLCLRWAWHQVQFLVAACDGGLGYGEFGLASGHADRPHQQRWQLRGWKSALPSERPEPSQSGRGQMVAQVSRGASGNKIRGRDIAEDARPWRVGCGDNREIQHSVVQAKRPVWDILNAGPRHSFTVEGLLVHNCLVLDFAGNVARHGPVDGIAMPGEKGAGNGDGEAPTKTCPECQSILLIAARECPDCGFLFPEPEPKIERTASTEAIMILTAEDEWQSVTDFAVSRHSKAGSPDSLRAEYLIGGKAVSEWICLEHTGFARQKAVAWWLAHAAAPVPDTVAEALLRSGEITPPDEAVIIRDGKYWRLKRARKARRDAA